MHLLSDPVILSIIGKAIGIIFFAGVICALIVVFIVYRLFNR